MSLTEVVAASPLANVRTCLTVPGPDASLVRVMVDRMRQDRIGSALHALAADLVTERRRVLALERENKRLRAQLAALQREMTGSDTVTAGDLLSGTDCPDAALSV